MIIIALGLVLLLITGVTAVVISMRNSDTEW